MIWDFFEARDNRRVAGLVRSLHLSAHPDVHRSKAAKIPPADIFRILACFPNLRRLTLANVNWVLPPKKTDWTSLESPNLEQLRIEFSIYNAQFGKQKLDVLLSPLVLFKNVKSVTISGFAGSSMAGAANVFTQQVVCNAEHLCIRGSRLGELLRGFLHFVQKPGYTSRVHTLEIGKIAWYDELSLTLDATGRLLQHIGDGIRCLTLCIGGELLTTLSRATYHELLTFVDGATDNDHTSLLSHCSNLTELVICGETDIGSTKHEDHGNELVLGLSFLRNIHACKQLRTIHFIIRAAAPLSEDDVDFCYEDYLDCGDDSCPVIGESDSLFCSIACADCIMDKGFNGQLEEVENALLSSNSLTTVAFAFYTQDWVDGDQTVAALTFTTESEMVKMRALFTKLDRRGMLKAITEEALDWHEDPDSEGYLHPRPRVSL